jgi:gliding motility-associated-like protein
MKRFLLTISIVTSLFSLPRKVAAQSNQTVSNGTATAAANFPGTGCVFNWVNDTPGIGLAASGTGNVPSFTAVNTGITPITATITATPVPTGNAYITNAGSNTVSVINTATNVVTATLTVGTNPRGVTVSPDGSRAYVTNPADGTVSVINTATNTVISTISVASGATFLIGLSINPDGSKLYVADSGSNSVYVVNTATNIVVAKVAVGIAPTALCISPDGSTLYVTNYNSNTVSVINTATNTLVANISAGSNPYGVCISPNGNLLYIANYGSNTVSVINTTTNTLVSDVSVGSNPVGVSVSPDGGRLYVADNQSGNVTVINTATNAVISTIAVGSDPFGISVSPDGNRVYVANDNSGSVSVISTATNLVIATVNVGAAPASLGNFVAGGTGCTTATFTITVNPTLPTNIIATGNLAALSTTYGTASASTTFNVSGTNTITGILVTPPAGFEISTDDITFNNTAAIGAAGTITPTLVYIRLAATTPVGNYLGNIILSSAGASNVNIAMPNSIVNPTHLTITANNKIKNYLQVNPVLTVTYNGFVNNDGPGQLTAQPTATTTAIITSPAGQYPITASGALSDNYTFIYVPGVLTINPGEQVIVIPNAFTPNGDGINDTWDIKNLDSYLNCTIRVYNRYGENVYSSIGYGIQWDGKYRGADLPTGTYYYIINLKSDLKVLSGFVAIIR